MISSGESASQTRPRAPDSCGDSTDYSGVRQELKRSQAERERAEEQRRAAERELAAEREKGGGI